MRILANDISSIFFLCWSCICLQAIISNTLRCNTFGLLLDHFSSGVMLCNLLVGHLLKMYVDVDIASVQNSSDKEEEEEEEEEEELPQIEAKGEFVGPFLVVNVLFHPQVCHTKI